MKTSSASLREYARGITGGLLFSLPLLYTMEVWWAGFSAQPYQLLFYIAATFGLLLGYNRYAGVHEGAHWNEVLIDSVEEIGIGLVISLLMLWTLGRIDLAAMGTEEIVSKIVVESMTVAIGVSVGTAQLGGEQEQNDGGLSPRPQRSVSLRGSAVLALCGGVLIAGNVAPTEEIPMIAMEISAIHLLVIAVQSVALGMVILFFSNFKGGAGKTSWTLVILETATAYIISLLVSVFMLWFFGRLDGVHFDSALSQVIVLGFPAMLGASAGRLLIK